jgi:hypothetical protein
MTVLVLQFQCLVYEKPEYYSDRSSYNYEMNSVLWKTKQTEQQISLLPKYTILIYRGLFLYAL